MESPGCLYKVLQLGSFIREIRYYPWGLQKNVVHKLLRTVPA